MVFLLRSLGSFHYSTSLQLAAASLFFAHRLSRQLSWRAAGEKISCQLSLLPSRLIFFFLTLPPPQPSSPDKKEPLLRCFAGHYNTVAMDTQSEQAPHAGSRERK